MTCKTCPFAWWSEESTKVQNLGCLPTPAEIIEIKKETNKNWSCHGDETQICGGFVEACKELNIDYKSGPFASYNKWYHTGEA